MKNLLSMIIVLGLMTSALAVDNEQRISRAYEESDKAFDLECYYFSPDKNLLILPTTSTTYIEKKITRDFSLKLDGRDLDMRVSVFQKSSSETKAVGNYKVSLGSEDYTGFISDNFYKGFYLQNSGSEFDNKFEVDKLYCTLNVARTSPYVLDNSHSKLHINVHPHLSYDYFNETTENVQSLLDENSGKNIVLIEEEEDVKGQFVDLSSFLETGVVPDLPKIPYQTPIDIPLSTDIIVSPAGHNRYTFAKMDGEIDITFTGGFHNYCVWNNTRNILRSLFRSESKAKVIINYKLDSMIVQRVGIIGGLSFLWPQVRKTRLLSNLVEKNPKHMKNYFKNYFQFFSGSFLRGSTFGSFTSTFKTLTINYKSPLFEDSVVIQGNGIRDLEVAFNYL